MIFTLVKNELIKVLKRGKTWVVNTLKHTIFIHAPQGKDNVILD